MNFTSFREHHLLTLLQDYDNQHLPLDLFISHYFRSHPVSPHGIHFHKKINFFNLPEFKEGLFEVQDEGSQLLASISLKRKWIGF
jgi:hypothetical protein